MTIGCWTKPSCVPAVLSLPKLDAVQTSSGFGYAPAWRPAAGLLEPLDRLGERRVVAEGDLLQVGHAEARRRAGLRRCGGGAVLGRGPGRRKRHRLLSALPETEGRDLEDNRQNHQDAPVYPDYTILPRRPACRRILSMVSVARAV